MKKNMKKLILGLAIFFASLGFLPTLVSFAAPAPTFDVSSTCETLSIDIKKFPEAQPAVAAVPEISHVEYLWKHKNNSNTQWSATSPGSNWALAVPNQQKTVITQQAQPAIPAKNNTIKVTIDAAIADNTTFSTSFAKSYTFSDKYTGHPYVVEAVAWDNPNYTYKAQATSTPCDNDQVKKIAFCHATASATNPYNYIDTSVNAFFNAGHDTHQNFGDIVPPFSYVKQGQTINFPGLNWDAAGQATFNNGCNVPVTKVAAFTVSILPATCDAGQKLVYGTAQNVIVSGTANNTYGPANYQVQADAVAGAAFDGDDTSIQFTGVLNGPLTSDVCDADAALVFTEATCESGEKVTVGQVTNATLTSGTTSFTGPGSYSFDFNATGVATFSNGKTSLTLTDNLNGPLDCEEPVVLDAAAVVHIIPATCESGDVLKYDASDATNASFDPASTPSGTKGATSYEVTVYADKGAVFADGPGVSVDGSTLTFAGDLNGAKTGDDCVLGEETPQDPATPAVLPNTAAGNTSLIVLIAGAAVTLTAGIAIRRFVRRGL